MTTITKDNAIVWLRKEIETSTQCAKNSRVIEDALQDQVALFSKRTESPWNQYAVRMAFDHRNSAAKDELARDTMTEILRLLESAS